MIEGELPDTVMARTSYCSDVTKWVHVSGDIWRCTCCNYLRHISQLTVVE